MHKTLLTMLGSLCIVIFLNGCASWINNQQDDIALINVELLVYQISPQIAKEWGLDGAPGTNLSTSPLKKATPRMMNPVDSDVFIKGLKQQNETELIGSLSLVVPSGEEGTFRYVSEIPVSSKNRDKETVDTGARLIANVVYDKTKDLIHLNINPQMLVGPSKGKDFLSRYDTSSDIVLKNKNTAVLTQLISSNNTPIIFLLKAEKIGMTDFSSLKKSEDIDKTETSFNPVLEMAEVSVVFMQVPKKIIEDWGLDGSPPKNNKLTPLRKRIPKSLTAEEATVLITALKKTSGTEILSSTSSIGKLNSEITVRAVDELSLPNKEETTEVGSRVTYTPVVVRGNPLRINLEMIPVVQLHSKGIITALTLDSRYSLENGHTLFFTETSKSSDNGLITFISAKLIKTN